DEFQEPVPGWLPKPNPVEADRARLRRALVPLRLARQGHLVHRRASSPLRWLWAWLRGQRLDAPEILQAGTLVRLERSGIRMPRLLAFGQRDLRPWRAD